MALHEIILLCLTGIVAGIIAGGLGVGGGIIIVPALVFIFGFTQHQVQGTSLALLLMPVGILAVMNYHKKGFVNYHYAAILIVTFVIGSYFGSLLSVNLSDKILKKAFGVMMLIAGAKMVFGK